MESDRGKNDILLYMSIVLAFDVYGTLIDPAGITRILSTHVGSDAAAFATRWREKQLEYTFRRGLMGQYVDFATCTAEALQYVCAVFAVSISATDRKELMTDYGKLPAFADAVPALAALPSACRVFAFSNGTAKAVQQVLTHNNLLDSFADIISVDEIKSYKPNPQVYAHFLKRTSANADESWLISGNPFDIIGAQAAGMRAVWVNRGDAIFDPWDDFTPDKIVASLQELPALFSGN